MGIKFCSLSSGSSGNSHYIESKHSKILIDAGFSGKRIQELLKNIKVCPETLDAIFVTHEHMDHIQGVGVLSRRFNLPIYANKATWLAMKDKIGKIEEENMRFIKNNEYLNFRDLDIKPIDIYHDAVDPLAYIINKSNKKISLVTDTGMLDKNHEKEIKDSDLLFIESNHDEFMLEKGLYPRKLKDRISGINGHLSNRDAAEVLGRILKAQGEVVLLGHLSKDNNVPDLAYETVRSYLSENGVDAENDISLELSYRNKNTGIFKI